MNDTTTTWSAINAMSRSHAWSVTRGIPSARTCRACGDDSGTDPRRLIIIAAPVFLAGSDPFGRRSNDRHQRQADAGEAAS